MSMFQQLRRLYFLTFREEKKKDLLSSFVPCLFSFFFFFGKCIRQTILFFLQTEELVPTPSFPGVPPLYSLPQSHGV